MMNEEATPSGPKKRVLALPEPHQEDPALTTGPSSPVPPVAGSPSARVGSPSAPRESKDWKKEICQIAMNRKVWIALGVVVGLIGLKVLVSYLFRDRVEESAPIVQEMTPKIQSMTETLSLPGNIEAIQQASVFAHVSGYLRKLYVDEGDHVKSGQLLAEIESPEVTGEYSRNKADLNLKKVTKQRYDELLRENVISRQEYDTVYAAYDETKARYDSAAANIDYTRIRAPFDGQIARRYKYTGDLIQVSTGSSQEPIFMIVNESHLRVSINVPQIDVSNVHEGDPVEIHVDSYPGQKFLGKVSRLDDLLDMATKTQRVLIDIDNLDGKLHAGMFSSVVLQFSDHANVVSVLSKAIEMTDDKNFIYVDEGGVAHKKPVTLGIHQNDWVEIKTGIAATDHVILKGLMLLTDGEKIQVSKSKN